MNTKGIAFALLAALTLAVTACKDKDIFNKETYENLVKGEFPIDTVDQYHDWNLLQTMMVSVTANLDIDESVARVQILSANPYASTTAEVLAEKFAQQGERVRLAFEMPKTQKQLCAAAVTRSGKYYVKPFTTKVDEIDFSSGVIMQESGLTVPDEQTFTYLYEEDFPVPGDFDYNDVVLRIAKSVPSANILRLRVTLAAVGGVKQVAAAIRLVGISYDQVEDVSIAEGTSLDAGYPFPHTLTTGNLLAKGRDGSAVINLFEDAHWALSPELLPIGSVARKHLNTEHADNSESRAEVAEQTLTFSIRLKDGLDVSYFALSDFDPFIIESYNGINYEVHTYRFKFDEVLWSFSGGNPLNYDDHLAWALLVPDEQFRYPIEGIPLCTYRNGEIFGAYNRYLHSFGEWGHNRNVGTDWYLYPSTTLVY